jgi:hypothetical protein
MRLSPQDIQLMKDAGLVTYAENPWANPDSKLYKIAVENGYKIRPGKIVKKTPRWAKARMHLEGMSANQLMVIKHLVETIRAAERDETGKLKVHPTVLVKEAFKNWQKAPPKPRRKGLEGIQETLARINKLLAEKLERRPEEVEAIYVERRRPLARA